MTRQQRVVHDGGNGMRAGSSVLSALPRNFFDKALHRDGKLTKEPFDNGSTFCKLVLHLDVEDVCH